MIYPCSLSLKHGVPHATSREDQGLSFPEGLSYYLRLCLEGHAAAQVPKLFKL